MTVCFQKLFLRTVFKKTKHVICGLTNLKEAKNYHIIKSKPEKSKFPCPITSNTFNISDSIDVLFLCGSMFCMEREDGF